MPPTNDGLPGTSHIGRVALTTNDRSHVASFYRDVIGLSVLSTSGAETYLGIDETVLLVLLEDESAPERPRSSAGLYHLAIRVPSRAALGSALARIQSTWTLDGASDHAVSEALYLTDPEGNGVEVYHDRPQSDWPIAADGSVEMVTEPLDLDDLAATSDDASRCPSGTSIGHVHLEVTSIATAHEFYTECLGLNVRQSFGDSALFLAAGDYHHHVGANIWNSRTTATSGRGLVWFEFALPNQDALAATRERLQDKGVDIGDLEEDSNGVVVCDPDGIEIHLSVEM